MTAPAEKNLPTTVPVELGFCGGESHKYPAYKPNARLVAEKATENCLLWSWERFMMQMKTNDRGLE